MIHSRFIVVSLRKPTVFGGMPTVDFTVRTSPPADWTPEMQSVTVVRAISPEKADVIANRLGETTVKMLEANMHHAIVAFEVATLS